MVVKESALKKTMRGLQHDAYMEIVTLRAEHPQKPDLVNQLDKAFSKVFKAIFLVTDEIDKLKSK
jgi:hypothetical protein